MGNKISLEIIFWNHAIIFIDGLVSNQLYNDIFRHSTAKTFLQIFKLPRKRVMQSFVYIASQMLWNNIVCKYKSWLSWVYLDQLSPFTLQ